MAVWEGGAAWGGETSDKFLEADFFEAMLREELRKGALDLRSGKNNRYTVSW